MIVDMMIRYGYAKQLLRLPKLVHIRPAIIGACVATMGLDAIVLHVA